MKKLFSIIVLTASCCSLYPMTTLDGKNVRILKNENGQFTMCRKINKEQEECMPMNIDELKKIVRLTEENEKQAAELVQKILIAEIRYNYLTIKMLFSKTEPKTANSTQSEVSEEELKQLLEILENPNKAPLMPRPLSNFIRGRNNEEFIRSMLPEEEQKMVVEISEMMKKLYETESQNTSVSNKN